MRRRTRRLRSLHRMPVERRHGSSPDWRLAAGWVEVTVAVVEQTEAALEVAASAADWAVAG